MRISVTGSSVSNSKDSIAVEDVGRILDVGITINSKGELQGSFLRSYQSLQMILSQATEAVGQKSRNGVCNEFWAFRILLSLVSGNQWQRLSPTSTPPPKFMRKARTRALLRCPSPPLPGSSDSPVSPNLWPSAMGVLPTTKLTTTMRTKAIIWAARTSMLPQHYLSERFFQLILAVICSKLQIWPSTFHCFRFQRSIAADCNSLYRITAVVRDLVITTSLCSYFTGR